MGLLFIIHDLYRVGMHAMKSILYNSFVHMLEAASEVTSCSCARRWTYCLDSAGITSL